jgi:hypothetical protein
MNNGIAGYREYPVVTVADGGPVVGVLTSPLSEGNGVRVVFLPGAGIASVGNARLFVELARELADMGCESLRIDPPGTAESESDPFRAHLPPDLAEPRVEGLLPAIVDASATLHRRLVAVGECLGARMWLALAPRLPTLSHLILVCPPVATAAEGTAAARREARTLVEGLTHAMDRGVNVELVYGERDVDLPAADSVLTAAFGRHYRSELPRLDMHVTAGKLHGIASGNARDAVTEVVRRTIGAVAGRGEDRWTSG